jgi:hypothetical protein
MFLKVIHRQNPIVTSFIVAYVFIAAVMYLLSHCLAMIGGYTYTQMDGRDF